MLAEKVACRIYIRFFQKKKKKQNRFGVHSEKQNFTPMQMRRIEDDNNNATKNQSLLHEA